MSCIVRGKRSLMPPGRQFYSSMYQTCLGVLHRFRVLKRPLFLHPDSTRRHNFSSLQGVYLLLAAFVLAGVVLSAACVAAGRPMSSTSLVHAVLRVEQLMTAGKLVWLVRILESCYRSSGLTNIFCRVILETVQDTVVVVRSGRVARAPA